MRNRKSILSPLFLGFFLLAACGPKTPVTTSQDANSSSASVCDEMFDDCGGSSATSSEEKITLATDSATNYTFDETDTNKDGAISYEIFVRSFYDSDGDGVGDLNGVKEKLPYLQDLGVKTVWLMPIMPSPSYHGYDVSDYYSINSDYGTMDDFTALTAAAAKANIDIMIDIVFNHSSSQNPWFNTSYQDYLNNNEASDSKKDWYVWSKTQTSVCNHSYGSLYYEGRFDAGMPDFNTENEAVRHEMVNILNFWIGKGVKGFRFDAVKYFDYGNTDYNVSFLTYLHDTIQAAHPDVYFVGENWESVGSTLNPYYRSTFESFFTFPSSLAASTNGSILQAAKAITTGSQFSRDIEANETARKSLNPNGYSSYFLSNHDMDRASHSLSGNYAKMAANITYLLPGTPYCYYGEEILLKGKRITNPDDQSDARRRLPMIWSKSDKTGQCSFPEKNRTDLATNDQVSLGAEDQLAANFSITNHYKKVFHVRNHYPFFKNAVYKDLTNAISTSSTHVIAYSLTNGDDSAIVIHNCETLNHVKIDLGELTGYHIADSVSCTRTIPELEGTTLKLGRMSSVILTR